MADTKFKGNPVHTNGALPKVGDKAKDFNLVDATLAERSLADYAGKKKVLTVNPSLDTGVCQTTARSFNKSVGSREDTVALVITADLPFAQKRFCASEGLDGVTPLSSFRSTFARDYGLELTDGPLKGLTARAVIVLDENDIVKHVELVSDIVNEPNYDAAIAALG
jgi:thiol peroxidase